MSQEPKVTRFGADPTVPQEIATKAYVDAGGGGGLTFAKVITTTDQVLNNSSTLQDDDDLKFTPTINLVYTVMLYFYYTGTGFADIKYAMSIPVGATARRINGNFGEGANSTADATVSEGFGLDANQRMTCLILKLEMGATAGDFILQWAQNNQEATNLTRHIGSMLLAWEQ